MHVVLRIFIYFYSQIMWWPALPQMRHTVIQHLDRRLVILIHTHPISTVTCDLPKFSYTVENYSQILDVLNGSKADVLEEAGHEKVKRVGERNGKRKWEGLWEIRQPLNKSKHITEQGRSYNSACETVSQSHKDAVLLLNQTKHWLCSIYPQIMIVRLFICRECRTIHISPPRDGEREQRLWFFRRALFTKGGDAWGGRDDVRAVTWPNRSQ